MVRHATFQPVLFEILEHLFYCIRRGAYRPDKSYSPLARSLRRKPVPTGTETLDDLHTALDQAVLDAYGWPHRPSDEQILVHLLKLNLERAGK